MFDIEKIPYDDAKTWELISEGRTLGVFQCESRLVQTWLKKIKPQNIWELSTVVAIVRPGPLQSGFAEQFVTNKANPAIIPSLGHPIIDATFRATNGVLLFQENLMALGARLAWPDLPEAERGVKVDNLRKGVGKKDQAKLVAIGKEFVTGCIRNGVDQEIADKLFDIIKNCGRYLFNLSHSIKYADIGYQTAYLKANYPLQFYAAYLTYSLFKQNVKKNESYLKDLINDARKNSVNILPPNINTKNMGFCIEGDTIRFGLNHIKFFSVSSAELLPNIPPITQWQQLILISLTNTFGGKFNSRTLEALICCGCFCDIKLSRKTLLAIYNIFRELTVKELEWCLGELSNYPDPNTIPELLNKCAHTVANVRRRPILLDHIALFTKELGTFDNPEWVGLQEKLFMEISLTSTAIDNKSDIAAHTCLECHGQFPKYEKRTINVIVNKIIRTVTKNGKNPGQEMARISVYDTSGEIENLPVFPECYAEYKDLLIERNTVTLNMYMGNSGWVVQSLVKL